MKLDEAVLRQLKRRAAFDALRTLGYQPRVAITAEQLADDQLRERLIREKGMQVLQFWSDQHRETSIDVFVREPFPFDLEFDRATAKQLRAPARFVWCRFTRLSP